MVEWQDGLGGEGGVWQDMTMLLKIMSGGKCLQVRSMYFNMV